MRDVFVVPKSFFDDPQRIAAIDRYDAEIDRLAQVLVRLPIDTDEWQELQRDFNDIRVRIEVVQLLAYLITADSRYNKNVLIQRRLSKPPTLEEFQALLEEVKATVFRWPVGTSFQKNNVLLHRVHNLNKIRIED